MVSRETLIAEGLRALRLPLEIDADGVRRLCELETLLETRAVTRGFLSAGESERIVPRHLLESAALLRWLPLVGPIIDVGSGAGLPGVVLACLLSGPVILIEAQASRASFLREIVHELDLEVQVVHARAEAQGRGRLRESGAGVTARALAPPAEALELSLPLVEIGGCAALLVGPQVGDDGAATAAAADALGGTAPRLERFEVPGASEARWVMIVQKLRRTPERFPRPPGPRRRRAAGGDVA